MPVDNDAVLIALIAMVGTILTSAISAYVLVRTGRIEKQGQQTHDLVNGVSHALTSAQVGQAKVEGIMQGEQAQRDRQRPAIEEPAGVSSDPMERTAVNTEKIAENTEPLK